MPRINAWRCHASASYAYKHKSKDSGWLSFGTLTIIILDNLIDIIYHILAIYMCSLNAMARNELWIYVKKKKRNLDRAFFSNKVSPSDRRIERIFNDAIGIFRFYFLSSSRSLENHSWSRYKAQVLITFLRQPTDEKHR